MGRRLVFLASTALLLWACPLPGGSHTPISPAKSFPLSKGTHWIYQGRVRWTKEGSTELLEKSLLWEMEVVEAHERRSITAAVIKGHPADLAWYDEGKARGDYLIVRVGTGSYYLLQDHEKDAALRRLRDGRDALTGLVRDADLFLDLPLWPGKAFGDREHMTRSDGLNYWIVEDVQRVSLRGVKGVSGARSVTRYRMVFRTLPDRQSVEFVPGIGITRYIYAHHGTASEADVRLVEFHPGERSP